MKNLLCIFTTISLLIFTSFFAYGQSCDCYIPSNYSVAVSGLNNLTSGVGNVGVGLFAGSSLTTGNYSTALGHECLHNSPILADDNYITAMGYRAAWNVTGEGMPYSTLIGSNAAQSFNGGIGNTMLGFGAGAHGGGALNVFIGNSAGAGNSGDRNIMIGNDMHFSNTGSSYNNYLFIGTDVNKEFIVGDMANGKLGINTNTPQNALDVCGKIRGDEVIIENNWCDYVFYKNYKLPTLIQEAQHIEEKGHLIGFESEEDMNGEIHLSDVTKRQQVKIEEVMLHLIEMNERLEALEAENTQLKKEVKHLRSK